MADHDGEKIKVLEKIRPMKSNGGATVNVVHEDEIMPKVSRRTAGVPDLPEGTATSTDMVGESYIRVGDMGSAICAAKKEALRALNDWSPDGTFAYIIGEAHQCKPSGGRYIENSHFDTEKILLDVPEKKKRVTLCRDITTKEKFVRKQVAKKNWKKTEATIPLNMDHRNLVKLIGIIQRHEEELELLMENAGPSLQTFLQNKPLGQKEFLDVAAQVLKGLSYLHRHGITHHDLKPGNICLIETDDKLDVKLIDFGSARPRYQKVTRKDWTPEYMAPECCKYYLSNKNQDAITTKVDVFSFAMVCAFMKTHRHLLMRLVTDELVYEKGKENNMRLAVIKKIADGEESMASLIDDIQIDPGSKLLIKRTSSYCPSNRLSSEEALELVKELSNENQSHQPAVMTEESEVESCSGAKKARFSEIPTAAGRGTDRGTVQKQQTIVPTGYPARPTDQTQSKLQHHPPKLLERPMPDDKRAWHSVTELSNENQSHQPAVMTEESEAKSCSEAKKARFSEIPTAAGRGTYRGTVQKQQTIVPTGYPAGPTDQTQSKLQHHPPKLLERPMPDDKRAWHSVTELSNENQSHQPAVMTEESEVESCSEAKKARFSEIPTAAGRGTDRGTVQKQQTIVPTGYPARPTDQTQSKLQHHPPKLLERPMPDDKRAWHSVTAGRGTDRGTVQKQQTIVQTGCPTGHTDLTQSNLQHHPPNLLERPMPGDNRTRHSVTGKLINKHQIR